MDEELEQKTNLKSFLAIFFNVEFTHFGEIFDPLISGRGQSSTFRDCDTIEERSLHYI